MEENKQFQENLEKEWFSPEEIENVFKWLEDIEKWNVYTAEEVYKHLFNKKPVHA